MTFAAVAASLLILAVACDEPAPVEPAAPVFPELVENYAVAPGDTLELTFTPNMDWEVRIPEDTMDFFWLTDDGFPSSSVSGKASTDSVVVKICVSDKKDFMNHTTTVRLTMGGETKIIAKYMLPAQGKSVQIYACKLDEVGEFVFDENGNYMYDETPSESINLIWTGYDYRVRVKVVSNFEWIMELPQWANADIPEVRTGTHEFNIYGVKSKCPLDDTSSELFFKSGEEQVAMSILSIPGCRDILSFGLEMVTSLDFNQYGKYLTQMSFMEGPAIAWIEGSEDADVYAVEFRNGKYYPTGKPSWIKAVVEDYDFGVGADVIQRRAVEISVKPGIEDKAAILLFMPPLGAKTLSSVFTSDATAVKEEWSDNVIYVTRREYGFLTLTDEEGPKENGGSVINSDGKDFLPFLKGASHYYEVEYTSEFASEKGRFLLAGEFDAFKIFDSTGKDVTGEDSYFLGFRGDESNAAGTIDMLGNVGNVGYIVLYKQNEIQVAFRCTYAPTVPVEMVLSLDSASMEVAEANGITLEQIMSNETDEEKRNLYDQYKEYYPAPIYHLKYNVENVPLKLQIPNVIKTWMTSPYEDMEMVEINGKNYEEARMQLSLDGNHCAELNICRHENEVKEYFRWNILFMTADSSSMPAIVLVCTLDLR